MRIWMLFLLMIPIILLEATVLLLPITFIVVFLVSLTSTSHYRFLVVFLMGILFDLFVGELFIMSFFFLFEMGFISLYKKYFPVNATYIAFIFLFLEIGYFLISGFPIVTIDLLAGYILLVPLYFFIRYFLQKDELKQLQFDFMKP